MTTRRALSQVGKRTRIASSALLIALTCALAPAPAGAAPVVGVGDNSPTMFADSNFQSLGMKISRKIIPYDFHHDPAAVADLRAWVNGAVSLGIEPLVALEHSHVHARKLPSDREFRAAVSYLVGNFPEVRSLSPWNEANHVSQPTWKRPDRAARYFRIARSVCTGCNVVAADVLDQKNMVPWLKKFARAAGPKARLWGLHSYGDSNRRIPWARSGTRKLLATVKGRVWLTEVGGIVAFKYDFPHNESRAADAVTRTLRTAVSQPRIERVYLYSWYGAQQPGPRAPFIWDSGLVDAGTLGSKPRRGFHVLRNWLQNPPGRGRKPKR